MTWPELRQLAAAGFEIGSHACTHRDAHAGHGRRARARARRVAPRDRAAARRRGQTSRLSLRRVRRASRGRRRRQWFGLSLHALDYVLLTCRVQALPASRSRVTYC